MDGGLLVLSRFPIIDAEFVPFRISGLLDTLIDKGCMYVKINVNDNILNIIELHTQATYA